MCICVSKKFKNFEINTIFEKKLLKKNMNHKVPPFKIYKGLSNYQLLKNKETQMTVDLSRNYNLITNLLMKVYILHDDPLLNLA